MNQFLLLHPILYELLELKKEHVDLRLWLDSVPEQGTALRGCGHVSRPLLTYYMKKYALLHDNGYFSPVDQGAQLSGSLQEEDVRYLLANVRNVVFEVTDACNMACEYCVFGQYYSDHDARCGAYLDIRVARTLLTYLSGCWQSSLNASHNTPIHIGFYGGEPLLGFSFIHEVVCALKRQRSSNSSFSFGLTTNGVLLRKYMDFLVENDFQILVSLDGNEAHNAYRVFRSGEPAFAATVESALALREKYPEFFRRNVSFNAVLHNKNSVEGVYAFFQNVFDKVPRIAGLDTVGIAADRAPAFARMYRNVRASVAESPNCASIEAEMFLELPGMKELGTLIYQCSGCSYRDYNDLLYRRADQARLPTGTCLPFSRKLFVSVHGKILPCERVNHKYSLGTVDASGVTLDMAAIADTRNQQLAAMRQHCVSCCRADFCGVCILQEDAQALAGCPFFMDSERYVEYLARHVAELEAHPEYYCRLLDKAVIIG